ncbi:MAG: deoxycytidylate deaminase, partial [Desulfobaccales bacterium]
PSVIILGFTGSIGSGCTFISRKIPEISKHNYKHFKLSDIIRKHLDKTGFKDRVSIEVMQNIGNELRNDHGREYLIKTLIDNIFSEKEKYEDCNEIIIDGIKNTEEINYLRSFPYFFLFSIQADREIRLRRSIGKIVTCGPEFLEADKRDEVESYEYGQQVKACDYLADIILLNNDLIPDFPDSKKEEYIRSIYIKYIVPIEILREGKHSPDIKPSIDEFSMTTAYAISKMSSCEKRKVGAVIVDIHKPEGGVITNKDKKITEIPFIVSTGYNEVPVGSYMCIYDPEYQKCYRDYRQEQYAPKLKFCPNCGKRIEIKIECKNCSEIYDKFVKICKKCHKEIDSQVICDCGKNIFLEFLPGGKETPGKLLDLCRSLHAEENALLNLVKIGRKSNENIILYTTTQPCNLCANKIVAAGIKKVVFAEPYLMEESKKILDRGGVEVIRFQGVKSSAYFRLYQ